MTTLDPRPTGLERAGAAVTRLALAGDETVNVETRFGKVVATADRLIEMPQGPLGFTQHRRFALLDLPNPALAHLKLMQSLSDAGVSFVVAPTLREGGPYEASDLEEACAFTGFTLERVALLLIVTIRQDGAEARLTANLRAPVIVDLESQIGRQVVLGNAKYAVRHPL